MTATFKGFGADDLLEHFGVCRIIDPTHGDGWVIPYRTVNDQLYREKLIRLGGAARWLGPSRPQIPYGLETLRFGGPSGVRRGGRVLRLVAEASLPPDPGAWNTWSLLVEAGVGSAAQALPDHLPELRRR